MRGLTYLNRTPYQLSKWIPLHEGFNMLIHQVWEAVIIDAPASLLIPVWSIYISEKSYVAMNTPNLENPSCLQATLASLVDHEPSHTVPQVSFQHTSTRPCLGTELPTSLRSPLLQRTANTQET